ncbi:MAG: protein kinase, partial [Anaerolineaceae bacterium]|nr:protein kinase [Anaerolineaceae bacterium]
MWSVYRAFDSSVATEVPGKCNRNPAPESTTQFLREARLLASLRHPNLPRVIDYFIIGQNQFLVMDYVPGDDLENLLKTKGVQPVHKVIQWAEQIGSALTYLHTQNPPVIHRDIKPANLKLMAEGEAQLVDFGIAKAAESSQATATGALGYTPGFAPPEQYGGARTGPYSDQYALAATLYTLLTNQRPVDSIQRVLQQAVLTPITIFNPTVPAHVQQAIETAMSMRPEDRFASIEDFVQALTETSYQSTPAQPNAATIPIPSKRKTRSSAVVWILSAAALAFVLLVMAGAGGYLLWTQRIPLSSAGVTPLPAVIGSPSAAELTPSATATPSPTSTSAASATPAPSATSEPSPTPELSPTPAPRPLGTGKKVAFVSDRGENQTLQIWTMKVYLDHGGKLYADDFTQVTSGAGDKSHPAWSSDGKKVAFTNTGRYRPGVSALYLMDSNGGNLSRLSLDFIETSPFWTPDSQTLLYVIFARDHHYLYQRGRAGDYATPQPYDRTTHFGRLGNVADPSIAPDGSAIAYTRVDGKEQQIWIVDYLSRGAQTSALTPLHKTEREPSWSPDSH